jgi:hypothetical protein
MAGMDRAIVTERIQSVGRIVRIGGSYRDLNDASHYQFLPFDNRFEGYLTPVEGGELQLVA